MSTRLRIVRVIRWKRHERASEETFGGLKFHLLIGHKREDLITREVLFWPVHSYLVVYTDSNPLRIVRVIHGKRDVKKLLKKR